MAIEDLLTLYAMLAGVSDPIRKLANVHSKIQRAAAAADRICALMDRAPQGRRQQATRHGLPRHRQTDRVRATSSFSYHGGSPVLNGLSLTVRHGETIALVGPNGCGKTTLMNLLPRFWDVDSGAIRIDGHDIRDVQLRSLRTPDRHGHPGDDPVPGHDRQQHRLRRPARQPGGDRRGPPSGPMPTSSSRRCRRATTR